MAKNIPLLINTHADKIAYGIAGLSAVFFITVAFLSGGSEISPATLQSEARDLSEQLRREAAVEPVPPVTAAFATPTATTTLDSALVTLQPRIRLRVPFRGKAAEPPKNLRKVRAKYGEVELAWEATDHAQCRRYRLKWWFTDDEDNADGQGEVLVPHKAGATIPWKGDKFTDNTSYTFELWTLDGADDEVQWAREIRDQGSLYYRPRLEVTPTGAERFMPTPARVEVTDKSLGGLVVGWASAEDSFDPAWKFNDPVPDKNDVAPPTAFRYLLYRKIGDGAWERIAATEPNDAHPFGTTDTTYTDKDVQPKRKVLYGIRYYHLAGFPGDNNKTITFHGKLNNDPADTGEYVVVPFPKLRNRTALDLLRKGDYATAANDIRRDRNKKILWEAAGKQVFASPLVVLPQPVELEDQLQVELLNVTGFPSDVPDANSGNCYFKVTRWIDIGSAAGGAPNFVRLGAQFQVAIGQKIGGEAKPKWRNDEKIPRDDPLRKSQQKFKFETPLILRMYFDYEATPGQRFQLALCSNENDPPDAFVTHIFRARSAPVDWRPTQTTGLPLADQVRLRKEYETTIKGQDDKALNAWCAANGLIVPPKRYRLSDQERTKYDDLYRLKRLPYKPDDSDGDGRSDGSDSGN